MRTVWPFGRRDEQRGAETDRATVEARQRHEQRLEERRTEHEALVAEVGEMPEDW